MRFIEEIVVDRFLPTVRSLLAERLRGDGMTQEEVAETLGISQSAVSKYAAGAVTRERAVVEDPQVQDTIDAVARGLAAETMTPTEALIELEVLIRRLEEDGVLAELHQRTEPALAEVAGFGAIHAPDSPARERAAVLASLRQGLQRLTAIEPIAEQIPGGRYEPGGGDAHRTRSRCDRCGPRADHRRQGITGHPRRPGVWCQWACGSHPPRCAVGGYRCALGCESGTG